MNVKNYKAIRVIYSVKQLALSKKMKKQVSGSFSKIKSPVEVLLFTSGKYPRVETQTEAAMKEILSLSKKLKFKKYKISSSQARKYGIGKAPAIVLNGKEKGKIRFFGFPSGYLFPIFVMDILQASGVKQKIAPESAKKAETAPKKKTKIEVFVMPNDSRSSIAAKIAHDMGMLNKNVTADVIDTLLFPEMVRKYRIRKIPTTVINGRKKMFGVIPFSRLVEMLGR